MCGIYRQKENFAFSNLSSLLAKPMLVSRPNRFNSLIKATLFIGMSALAGCSGGDVPIEQAILGTWLQETPISMSADNLQTTTSETVLTLKKNGDVQLSRILLLQAPGLPEGGVSLNVDLNGTWSMQNGQLVQVAESTLITPRTSDDEARSLADDLQAQMTNASTSTKDVIAADKKQLILQDVETGATDIYRRK